MPIFYNTLSPTPTTKNTITSVATNYGVRDFLLNLNLLPIYPQISTSLNGSPKIGEPVLDTLVNNGSNVIPLNLPLETNGILFKDLNININTFQNSSSTANDLTNINYISTIPNVNFPNSNWPQGIQTYPTGANQDISDYGLLGKTIDAEFKKKNVIKNLYLDVTKQIDMADFIDLNPLDVSKQITGYLDQYGSLNLGGSGAIQAANVIGSVLNGQGLGFSKGGVVPNFDIRSSLAGRVLGAAGIINDTKLGMIGGQQLALALANNAAFNVQQEILGTLNVQDNILSLIKGDGFAGLRPSYKITIPASTGGRILDTAGKILGFTIPRSYLDDSGSLFQTENGSIGNIERANNMILNTGKGQIQALLTNVRANQYGTFAGGTDDPSNTTFRSGYAPAYANNKGEVQITDGILYAFSKDGKIIDLFGKELNSDIANISYNREEMVKNSGFLTPEDNFTGSYDGHSNSGYNDRKISDVGFTWTTGKGGLVNTRSDFDEIFGDKKSLLVKTQALFNSKGMMNVVTRKGDMNKVSTQTQTANGNGFSKGNAVMKADMFDLNTGRYIGKKDATAEETYCRSWTTLDRYDQISKLVRSGIDGVSSNMDSSEEFNGVGINGNVPYRFNTQGSVLDGYGIPKIAPYITDVPTDPKKFMFSIENLAWHGKTVNLPKAEKGPGDLLTGKKGRIMWFPPYNIQFSESSSVNWEATNFIGRGESIYTYNNTERSGNLSFQIIVDHPSYVNSFRGSNGPDDHYVNSFWAGCIDPDSKWGERLTVSERTDIINTERLIPQEKVVPEECEPGPLTIYYPNDNTIIEPLYENGINTGSTTPIDYTVNKDGLGQGLGTYKADYTPGSHNDSKKANGEGWPDRYNYGLNYSLNGSSPAATDSTSDVGSNGEKLFGYFDPNTDAYIIKHLTEICPHCVATITGYASEQGKLEYNKQLAKDRATVIKEDVRKKWWPSIKAAFPKLKESDFDKRFKIGETKQLSSTGCKPCDGIPKEERFVKCPTDTLQCKLDRRASISFKFDKNLAAEDIAQPEPIKEKTNKKIQNKIIDRYYNESKYFEKLTDADPFVFDSFREKIRYFHPAFHSTTPEGLNSRLTFLLQCTRQGPTLEDQGATNLAFGRPPVCILRIGDFYNTKIVMDNVSIDYEPLVWDLNPEGIGVQPMIANVSISFKFIGASSLMGPINKLQNALSFNYFANTQVYDPRADYITKEKPALPAAPASPTTPVDEAPLRNKAGSVIGTEADPIVLKEVVVTTPRVWHLKEGEIDISKDAVVVLSEETNVEIDQGKAAEIANSPAEAPQPTPSATTATTATTIDDTAVMGCFGYEGAYKIDQSDPTDFSVDIVMSWNAKKDVKDPELNASHNAFVYVKNGSKEQVVLGHIRISPNSPGNLIFKHYDDKNGSKTGGGSDQIISFAGQQNKTLIKFEVNFNIDDATKGKFILDAWNATGGNGSPSMIKIEWQDANGSGMNAGFSHLYALKFPNET
jgi:hypothetical protein